MYCTRCGKNESSSAIQWLQTDGQHVRLCVPCASKVIVLLKEALGRTLDKHKGELAKVEKTLGEYAASLARVRLGIAVARKDIREAIVALPEDGTR